MRFRLPEQVPTKVEINISSSLCFAILHGWCPNYFGRRVPIENLVYTTCVAVSPLPAHRTHRPRNIVLTVADSKTMYARDSWDGCTRNQQNRLNSNELSICPKLTSRFPLIQARRASEETSLKYNDPLACASGLQGIYSGTIPKQSFGDSSSLVPRLEFGNEGPKLVVFTEKCPNIHWSKHK